jgi:hypothetical protein
MCSLLLCGSLISNTEAGCHLVNIFSVLLRQISLPSHNFLSWHVVFVLLRNFLSCHIIFLFYYVIFVLLCNFLSCYVNFSLLLDNFMSCYVIFVPVCNFMSCYVIFSLLLRNFISCHIIFSSNNFLEIGINDKLLQTSRILQTRFFRTHFRHSVGKVRDAIKYASPFFHSWKRQIKVI